MRIPDLCVVSCCVPTGHSLQEDTNPGRILVKGVGMAASWLVERLLGGLPTCLRTIHYKGCTQLAMDSCSGSSMDTARPSEGFSGIPKSGVLWYIVPYSSSS